jgi:hypothetical protein
LRESCVIAPTGQVARTYYSDADLGVDQVLLDEPDFGWVHRNLHRRLRRTAAVSRRCRSVEPDVLEVDRLPIDAHDRRRDPIGKLAGSTTRPIRLATNARSLALGSHSSTSRSTRRR